MYIRETLIRRTANKTFRSARLVESRRVGRNATCCDSKQLFPQHADVALHGGTGEWITRPLLSKVLNLGSAANFLELACERVVIVVHQKVESRETISAIARYFSASRQIIMRVRDQA